MRLWVATDDNDYKETWGFLGDSPLWNDEDKLWNDAENQDTCHALDALPLMRELGWQITDDMVPPPGECWAFDVTFTRVEEK